MKKRMFSALLALCMALTLLPTAALAGANVMEVTVGGATTAYTDFAEGWNAAVAATGDVTVTLLADWTADESHSFGTGGGFGYGNSGTGSGNIRVPVGKTITLDLNGKTIDRGLTTATDYGSVIRIEGGNLTIMDSSTIDVDSQGTIKGAYNYDGGAVDVTKNTNSNPGFLTMTGGVITGNKAAGAKSGPDGGAGGVYLANDCGGFTMTGGRIFRNTVTSETSAGGVLLAGNAESCKLTVGGTAEISGNNKTVDTTTTYSNVFLPNHATIACSAETPLTVGASIGVTTAATPDNAGVAITGSNSADYSGYFHYDVAGAASSVNTADGVKFMTGVMSVDPGTGTTTTYNTFEAGWNAAVAAAAGVTATVTLNANWTARATADGTSFGTGSGFGDGTAGGTGCILVPSNKNITLNLSGHTINRALKHGGAGGNVVTVKGFLTIKDTGTTGAITGGYNSSTEAGKSGGGILMAAGSYLTLEGGSITGNKSAGSGGGVYAGGTFTMEGGEISGNYVCGSGQSKGGGVFFNGQFTVGGTAVIKDNKSGCTSAQDSTVSGGITDNVYVQSGKTIDAPNSTMPPNLTTSATIGVTAQTPPAAEAAVPVTGNSYAEAKNFFHSDNSNYEIDSGENSAVILKLKPRTATPTTTAATVAKAAATQASVSFTLTNGSAYADNLTWKVYTDAAGVVLANGVTAGRSGETLTLIHASDIPAATYYISVTGEPGKSESDRLALTVSAYVPPSSGSGGDSYTPTYSITGDTGKTEHGSVTFSNTNAAPGSTVKLTPKADEGYELDTLIVKDAKGNVVPVTKNADNTYSFKMPSGKVTVEATFKPIEAPWGNPFTDVAEKAWYYDAVKFANRKGLFAGIGADTFAPDAPMTRAMLWTVLGRLDGTDLSGNDAFDVARRWAVGTGITDGSNPGGDITREQLVTILWRYAGSPKTTGDLSGFSDVSGVADYAKEAMAWAVENDIVAGADGKLMPTGNAARAQVATILMRYCQTVTK